MAANGTSSNGDPRDLTKRNRVEILRHLVDGQTLSRVELARRTGLSPATVSRLTATMTDSGLLTEHGSDLTTGGRPSLLLRFDPTARRLLAADITPRGVSLAETDLLGRIVRRHKVTASEYDSTQSAHALVDAVADYLASRNADEPTVVAVGISVPGPVTEERVVTVAPALDWYDLDLGALIRGRLPEPLVVENDVNLIAFGEYFLGVDYRPQSLLAIATFEGVGAGIVEDGRLWRGTGGGAGQFGRMLVNQSGLRHGRHGFGQVESQLGATALHARAVRAGVFSPGQGSADELLALASSGHPEARVLFEQMMDEYAFALVNFCAAVAPQVVVFDGLLGRWSNLVLPALDARLRGNVLHEPELLPAALHGDGKLVGAALYALERRGGVLDLA